MSLRTRVSTFLFALALVAPQARSLAVPTWTGAVDNKWTTAGNWTGGVPTQFGVASVDFHASGAGNLTTDVNTGGQFFVDNVSTTANATSFAINNSSGGELAISGDVFINSGATNLAASIGYPIFFNKVANTTLTFNVDGPGRSLAITEIHRHVAGSLRPGQSVIKTGTGLMTMSANSNYHGTTFVNGGTLAINGTPVNGDHVEVNSTGTLRGTGTVLQPIVINAGGTLAPGNSIGTFNAGPLSLTSSTSALAFELNPTSSSADLLNVTGSVTLASATLSLSFLSTPTLMTPLTILLVANDGTDAVNGTFGSVLGVPGIYNYTLNYAFTGTDALGRVGTGNDVAITLTASVPEASAWAFGCVAVACGGFWGCRRLLSAC